MEIDEKALETAWLADGKPISWERLKWIVYEARAISQNRNKHLGVKFEISKDNQTTWEEYPTKTSE